VLCAQLDRAGARIDQMGEPIEPAVMEELVNVGPMTRPKHQSQSAVFRHILHPMRAGTRVQINNLRS